MKRFPMRPELILGMMLLALWLIAGLFGLRGPAESLAIGLATWIFSSLVGSIGSASLAVRTIVGLAVLTIVAGLWVARVRRQPGAEVEAKIELARRLELIRNLIADRLYLAARLHVDEVIEEYPDCIDGWLLKQHVHELALETELAAVANLEVQRLRAPG